MTNCLPQRHGEEHTLLHTKHSPSTFYLNLTLLCTWHEGGLGGGVFEMINSQKYTFFCFKRNMLVTHMCALSLLTLRDFAFVKCRRLKKMTLRLFSFFSFLLNLLLNAALQR